MLMSVLWIGFVVGVLHFLFVGALYGNPWIDRIYQKAQAEDPGVRKWSRGKYTVTQFLGTQVEVYILCLATFLFWEIKPDASWLPFALMLAAIRVYPRSWNMWIQSTYPNRLILIESICGTLSTVFIVFCAKLF